MAKRRDAQPAQPAEAAPRGGRPRSVGEVVPAAGGAAFRRFGFVQSAVVSRWPEIVGERYAKVSTPEMIRFPAGKRQDGTLHLLVEGAFATMLSHAAPAVIDRVNRFFGYPAVAKVQVRQGAVGRRPAAAPVPSAPPVPLRPAGAEVGASLRAIADPELRACLEALAQQVSLSVGPPAIGQGRDAQS